MPESGRRKRKRSQKALEKCCCECHEKKRMEEKKKKKLEEERRRVVIAQSLKRNWKLIDWPRPKKVPTKEGFIADLKRKYLRVSTTALEHYNKTMNTDFKLVKLVGGFQLLSCGLWQHVNFEAITKNDATPKLFFAEFQNLTCVTACSILSPDDSGIRVGCGFCDPEGTVRHPADGFQAGHYPYSFYRVELPNSPFQGEEYRSIINLKC